MIIRNMLPALIFLLLVNAAGAGEAGPFTLPPSKKDCKNCHPGHGPGGAATLKKEPSELCLDCHPQHTNASGHKVGVAPKEAVKELPLVNGLITCVTCHDPHQNLHGSLLRLKPKALCEVCHKM